MKTTNIFYPLFCCLMAVGLFGCVNSDYDFDNIDKQIVFSPNGIDIPIGDFDPIELNDDIYESEGIDGITYRQSFDNFFSEEMAERFMIENEEGDIEGLGDLELTAEVVFDFKNGSGLTANLKSIATDKYDDELFSMGDSNFDAGNTNRQPFKLSIKKNDIPKLKNAESFQIVITIDADLIDLESTDNVQIKGMRISSKGGISIDLDNM